MKTVTIHDAKTNLSKYIAAAKRGERVYIGGFGKAEVMLVKLSEQDGADTSKRKFKIAKGKVQDNTDAFSDKTEQKVASLLFGK